MFRREVKREVVWWNEYITKEIRIRTIEILKIIFESALQGH